eukprot:3709219-Rhodomonas_salina.10
MRGTDIGFWQGFGRILADQLARFRSASAVRAPMYPLGATCPCLHMHYDELSVDRAYGGSREAEKHLTLLRTTVAASLLFSMRSPSRGQYMSLVASELQWYLSPCAHACGGPEAAYSSTESYLPTTCPALINCLVLPGTTTSSPQYSLQPQHPRSQPPALSRTGSR